MKIYKNFIMENFCVTKLSFSLVSQCAPQFEI